MKKETLLAIFLGIIFGIFFSFIIVSNIYQTQLEEKNNSSLIQKKEPSISPVKISLLKSLTIKKPKDFLIVNSEKITIEGEVEKNSLIIIQSPIKDLIFQNTDEKFKIDFPLVLGENPIKIVAYPKNKNLKTQERKLLIYYLPKDI